MQLHLLFVATLQLIKNHIVLCMSAHARLNAACDQNRTSWYCLADPQLTRQLKKVKLTCLIRLQAKVILFQPLLQFSKISELESVPRGWMSDLKTAPLKRLISSELSKRLARPLQIVHCYNIQITNSTGVEAWEGT